MIPFGLCNAPSIFKRLTSSVVRDMAFPKSIKKIRASKCNGPTSTLKMNPRLVRLEM